MTEKRKCEECGAELPANAPQGLCPRCLASAGLSLLSTEALPKSDFEVERTGIMIGRYKLLEKIGEGGFGVVYMAEQQEPVQRKVALKIIKAGMDTREVIARFEAERQAIALMDHPNIARALDAGATEAGRPYFVMELVRGIPITDYCDQANLPTRERLQLFMKVCQAVQHAHQKGVIHRDLKPSNVLVTEHDGEPVPKVIDFGVAKALGQKLTEKTLFTGFQHMIGTPAYMSPEQAALSGLDIDTRADIYSLGVLLYELLTGVTPFDTEALRKAALDEIRRMIRETEPPKPSTRLQTLGEKLSEVAKHRHAEPTALSRLIRGDLDWIVMKCLEKDRKRRYETANGVASDIQRHLNCEPVIARPPSRLYEFQKTVRRHKFGFAAAAAVITVLSAGVLASTFEALRAKRAEQIAETKEKKSEQVAQFLKDMLNGVGPSVALGRDTTMLLEIVDKTAARISTDLKDQPEVEIELLMTLSQVYRDLEDYKKMEQTAREALRLARARFGEENMAVADALGLLGNALFVLRRMDEAETVTRQALAMQRKLLGKDSLQEASALRHLGDILRHQAGLAKAGEDKIKLTEAETATRACLAIRRKRLGSDDDEVAWALNGLSITLGNEGKDAEAESSIREAASIHRKNHGDDDLSVGGDYQHLCAVLHKQGKLEEAEAYGRKALELQEKMQGKGKLYQAWAHMNLASVLEARGKLDEAERHLREAAAIGKSQVAGEDYLDLVGFLAQLARLLLQEGKLAEARSPAEEAVAICQRHPGVVQRGMEDSAFGALGDVLRAQGKHAEAVLIFEKLVQENPKNDYYRIELGHSQWRLADALRALGQRKQAEMVRREALQIFEKAAQDFPGNPYLRQEQAFSLRELGDLVSELGRVDEAELQYRTAIKLYTALIVDAPTNSYYQAEEAYTTWMLAGMLDRAGRSEAAAIEYRQAIIFHEKAMARFPADKNLKPRLDSIRASLDSLLVSLGKPPEEEAFHRERVAEQRETIERIRKAAKSGDVSALNEVAWRLATCSFAELRDGPSAVSFAEKAVASTNRKEPNALDTLAAAYAESGQFAKAVSVQNEAINLLRDEKIKSDFATRLRLYELNSPYRTRN